MKATEILIKEHRVIEKVLDVLEKAANQLAAGKSVPMDFFFKAADFIKNFADGCHHQKEEGVLFVAMAANGVPQDDGPVYIMLAEHVEARRLTRGIQEAAEQVQAGNAAAAQQVIQNARDYVSLLREHIQKEDNVVFPMAADAIPVEQHPQVIADFERLGLEEIQAGVHEKYPRLADELMKIVAG